MKNKELDMVVWAVVIGLSITVVMYLALQVQVEAKGQCNKDAISLEMVEFCNSYDN